MPRFQYVAVDEDGRQQSGGLDAANESAARANLQKRKLLPVRIAAAGAERAERAPAQNTGAARGELNHKARLVLTRQLATLIEAAVPVDEALAMVAAQQDQAHVRRIISDVQSGVVEGQRLADAMGRHPKSFSGLYRSAIAGGERAGRLGFVLNRLADFLARAHVTRTKIQTAMIYPSALVLVAIIVVSCLMIFVVPTLAEQFQTFDTRLPMITQILIAVSRFLSDFWAILLAAIAGSIWLARVLLRRAPVRYAFDAMVLRAPVIGKWAMAVNASRFIRSVSTLVSSGLPVLDAVRAARESVENRVVARAITDMAERIEQGEPLSAVMRRSGVIPPMAAYMAASGENAGELSAMLDKAADHLDQEFEAFTASALALLEPAVIVFMGVVVASIVLAIMLPVLQLNRLATG
jgi:general secretion pathway protein F